MDDELTIRIAFRPSALAAAELPAQADLDIIVAGQVAKDTGNMPITRRRSRRSQRRGTEGAWRKTHNFYPKLR